MLQLRGGRAIVVQVLCYKKNRVLPVKQRVLGVRVKEGGGRVKEGGGRVKRGSVTVGRRALNNSASVMLREK